MVCRDVMDGFLLANITGKRYWWIEPLTVYIVLTLITASQEKILCTPFRTPGAKGSLTGSEPESPH